jgi:hypothetical protein
MFHIGRETCLAPIRWRRGRVAVCGRNSLSSRSSSSACITWVASGLDVDVLANVAVGKTPANRLLVLDARSGPGELAIPIVVVVAVALDKSGPSDAGTGYHIASGGTRRTGTDRGGFLAEAISLSRSLRGCPRLTKRSYWDFSSMVDGF